MSNRYDYYNIEMAHKRTIKCILSHSEKKKCKIKLH